MSAVVDPEGTSMEADTSIGELLSRLSSSTSELVAAEIALAKAEAKEQAQQAAKGVGLGVGAALFGIIALALFGAALAWGLAEIVEPGWAFLIVTVLYLAVAAALAVTAKNLLRRVEPVPETVESLKEDVQWARQQLS